MGDRIRIGLIGCGDIAATRHIPTLAASRDVDLAVLCDKDTARAEKLASQYGVKRFASESQQVLQDPSLTAVVIATPPWVTPLIAMDALRAGKHVLCEKPMAVDLETAEKVREVERATGNKVQVGFTYRHGLLLETMRRWIREGRLGSPLIFRMGVFDEVWNPEGDREHYQRIYRTMEHGSPSIHDGAHTADFLHFLSGSQVESVWSYGLKTRPEFPSTNYDTAVVRFANGDVAKVEICWFLPVFPKGEFEVLGPLGLALFNRDLQYVRLQTAAGEETVSLDEDWASSCFREQLRKFVESIRSDRPCVPGTTDGINSLRLTKAIEAGIKGTGR